MILGLIFQAITAFTPFEHAAPILLFGHFLSCPEPDVDDGYGELAYEHQTNGKVRWTFHMGPRDEFALNVGAPAEHFTHDSVFNRLGPAFHYDDVRTRVGGRNWSAMGLHINVIRVPSSDDSCYAWLVKIVSDPIGRLARFQR